MKIYTLVLETVNDESLIRTYACPAFARSAAIELAKEFSVYREYTLPDYIFSARLDDGGGTWIYIKETELLEYKPFNINRLETIDAILEGARDELIGGDHE